MKAVIMAGGRGTRIAALAGDLPKPMLPIDGRPVLERELGSLQEQGVTDVLITVGHLAPAIMEYFGDGSGCSPQTGRPFGVHIEYFVEKEPLGNAGALFRIRDRLDEDFLLLNGDVMFDVDLQRFAAFHKVHGGLATLFTHPNGHPYDSGLIMADSEQRVTQWLTKEDARPQYYRNRVNAGLHILSPKLLEGNILGPADIEAAGGDGAAALLRQPGVRQGYGNAGALCGSLRGCAQRPCGGAESAPEAESRLSGPGRDHQPIRWLSAEYRRV